MKLIVDQAWHLHLTYSRSYWERFCGQVLGQPLHHQPTSGGAVESGKFHNWYSQTLKSYERIFGERLCCGKISKLRSPGRTVAAAMA